MENQRLDGRQGRDLIEAPLRMDDGGGDGPDKRRNVPLPPSREPRPAKNMMVFFFIVMAMVTFLLLLSGTTPRSSQVPYSTFLSEVTNQRVERAVIVEREIEFVYRLTLLTNAPAKRAKTYIPYHDPDLLKILADNGVRVEGEEKTGSILSIFLNLLPWVVLIFFVWFLMVRQMQGNNNKALSFGKSRARLVQANQRKITFKDVAGVEEAKQELVEIIEFLVDPAKFRKLGARIPKGVLLVGPPGTGKTLLARAVAGEANVPFFSISGSDFVEMFVGVGASRVRDLFEQGKKKAPCILFIDELDAVGRSRGAGYGGGHDEREQTLNQMLVEMDGFEANDGLIVIAATNRPDVLDPALLRPGRFDRQVVVDVPDVRGREAILNVHSAEKPVGAEVDLSLVARGTPGFTGADLENMVNEAALLAARRNKKKIGMDEFEEAKDKVLMGPERRSLVISETEKQTTAWHEAGHALLGFLLPHADPIHKVTIIPRGRALGLTQSLPIDDRHSYSREFLKDQIALLMGGRVAEEMYAFGNVTNGASNDIERATNLARAMVCEWGMSEKLGPLSYGQKEQPIFIAKEISRHKDYSERVAEQVDGEIRAFVEEGFQRARELLKRHRKALDVLSGELLQREALDGKELEKLLHANGVKKGTVVIPAIVRKGGATRAIPKAGTPRVGRTR